jgi:glucose-6-phosphate 1-dehydrogenase
MARTLAKCGNSGRFARQDYVEEAWRIVDPILGDVVPCLRVRTRHMGPSEVDALVAPDGEWFDPRPKQ